MYIFYCLTHLSFSLSERERKKATKVVKETQEKELVTVEALVQKVLEAVAQETFPEAPEAKEAYFMDKVSIGEGLCAQGEDFYDESVEHFYKALKIYPAPLELIMIYQKTLPEKVFRIIVNLMALEVIFFFFLYPFSWFTQRYFLYSNKSVKPSSTNISLLPKQVLSSLNYL